MYISKMVINKKIKINQIYGISVGAIIGVLMLQTINSHDSISFDDILDYSNNELKLMYKNNIKIAECYKILLNKILSDDIYEFCTNKLIVNFNVLTKYGFQQKVISKYISKQHVINCVIASASIPYLSINTFYTKYVCPSESITYMAFDGCIFNDDMLTNTYPSIYIDLLPYNYNIIKRFMPIDTCIIY